MFVIVKTGNMQVNNSTVETLCNNIVVEIYYNVLYFDKQIYICVYN